MKRAVSVIALLFLCAMPAAAHHGKDFLVVESYELPHPGNVYFVSSEIVSHSDAGTFFATEPSLLFGIVERFAGEVHVHVAREPGESLRYEAIAPAVHVQLTPPESSAPWRLALAAEYEIARHSEENSLGARLIMARSFSDALFIANIGGDHSQVERTHAFYALGFRPHLDVQYGWGIEAQGRFQRGQRHEVLLGVYTQPTDRLTFKIGAGTGLGNGKPSPEVRTGIVWRF